MSGDSTSDRTRGKAGKPQKQPGVITPKKPRKDFPLSIHKGTRYWCKKINGHVYYFGSWDDDPKGVAALEKYLADKDDLKAGRIPRTKDPDAITIQDLCNEFCDHHDSRVAD